jgi:hypothetical protein
MKQSVVLMISLTILFLPWIGLTADTNMTFAGTGAWNLDFGKSDLYPKKSIKGGWKYTMRMKPSGDLLLNCIPGPCSTDLPEEPHLTNIVMNARLIIEQSDKSIRITYSDIIGENSNTYIPGKIKVELIETPSGTKLKKETRLKLGKNKIEIEEVIFYPGGVRSTTNTTLKLLKNGKMLRMIKKETRPFTLFRPHLGPGAPSAPIATSMYHTEKKLFFNK